MSIARSSSLATPITRETRTPTEEMTEASEASDVTLTLTRGELALIAVALEERELKLRRDSGNGNPAFGRINPALWAADAKSAEYLADRLRSLAARREGAGKNP